MKAGAIKEVAAHRFERELYEHYVEPAWVDRVIFEAEVFRGAIHDPCCGFGTILYAASAYGLRSATGTDIVDRGRGWLEADFLKNLQQEARFDNIVMNPPFNSAREFITQACRVSENKVAALMPTRRLNAAHWLRNLPLRRIWYLTPRPSMLPGHLLAAGQKAGGGQQDYCWLVFAREGSPYIHAGWLHRDKGAL